MTWLGRTESRHLGEQKADQVLSHICMVQILPLKSSVAATMFDASTAASSSSCLSRALVDTAEAIASSSKSWQQPHAANTAAMTDSSLTEDGNMSKYCNRRNSKMTQLFSACPHKNHHQVSGYDPGWGGGEALGFTQAPDGLVSWCC